LKNDVKVPSKSTVHKNFFIPSYLENGRRAEEEGAG
jgi:hypothetical protein